MSVLFFSAGKIRVERQVRNMVRELGQGIEIYRSVKRLTERIEKPRGVLDVAILLIRDQTILNDLISIRDQIYELPVVLILSKSDSRTMLKAHKFYPRFITFIGNDFHELKQVLQKILYREIWTEKLKTGLSVPLSRKAEMNELGYNI